MHVVFVLWEGVKVIIVHVMCLLLEEIKIINHSFIFIFKNDGNTNEGEKCSLQKDKRKHCYV